MNRIAASPLVHFVLIGAVLYLAQGLWKPAAVKSVPVGEQRQRIVVTGAQLERLRDDFRQTTGREVTADDERALIGDFVDQEILYREALARGMDKADRSVKGRLVQKMHFVEGREEDPPDVLYREAIELGLDRGDIVIRRLLIQKMKLLIKLRAVNGPPDEKGLREFFTAHAEDYRQPTRVSLQHVFLSADKRKDSTGTDAESLLDTIRRDSIAPRQAIAMGDVFPFGHELRQSSEHKLAKLLGPDLAKRVIDLTPGAWHGPFGSPYGAHLVWIDERVESTLPGLEAVRNQVVQRYLAELREAELEATMEKLRERYSVTIAGASVARG